MATRTLAAATVVALLAANATLAEAQTVMGVGYKPCSEYTALSTKTMQDVTVRMMAISWVQGFATATNFVLRGFGNDETPDILAGVELSQIADSVNSYCKAHPKNLVSNAAMEVVKQLGETARLHQSLFGGGKE